MAQPTQEQVLSLLTSMNNHGDLAVKLSSLKKVKDTLLSSQPTHDAKFFLYSIELQTSPDMLVCKYLFKAKMFPGMFMRMPDKAEALKQPKTHAPMFEIWVDVIWVTPYLLHYFSDSKEELKLEL
ncbi:mitochondrial import receptor subunit TOM6 homolog [Olea europaea subsp. europaea]|uniref:Mitochondrial import receptor subunit TOM6 homolog n=1 Tax=Olea europaea subsp. europaea TaxID=158383 RepID=A0A8S0V0E9_OLEEU|nr:mitochondrial import receptor subunit TOM6 homolog [Olea europaea subsp. europaea]